MAGKFDRYDPGNDGQGPQEMDSGDYGQPSGRATGPARETASHNSRAPTISKASPNGTMKYISLNSNRPATMSSLLNWPRPTSMAASNTPSDPGAWLAKPNNVANTKITASATKSMAGSDGISNDMATAQKNFERTNMNLSKAAKTPAARVNPSDALEKATRIEAAVTEAGDRLRARWQLEQAARERETKQREREAAERARGAR